MKLYRCRPTISWITTSGCSFSTSSASKLFCQRYTARLKCSDRIRREQRRKRVAEHHRARQGRPGNLGDDASVAGRGVGAARLDHDVPRRLLRHEPQVFLAHHPLQSHHARRRSCRSSIRVVALNADRSRAAGTAGTCRCTASMICWYARKAPRSFQCVSVWWNNRSWICPPAAPAARRRRRRCRASP